MGGTGVTFIGRFMLVQVFVQSRFILAPAFIQGPFTPTLALIQGRFIQVLAFYREPFQKHLEPIREVWIHDEWFAARRLSIMRIMARRTKAATVVA